MSHRPLHHRRVLLLVLAAFSTMLLAALPYVLFAVYLGEALIERNAAFFALVLVLALVLGLSWTVLALRALQREMHEV